MMREGDEYRFRANYGFTPEAVQYSMEHPLKASSGSATGRVALEGRAIHISDVLADPEYQVTGYQQAFGYRTILGVPLLREGTTIGVFVLTRDEVNPFTDKQIELVTTFADQAVIAIENVRLFDEVQRRTQELSESLEQQTATSEVLKVISSSASELQPVFDTMAENAVKLCGAERAYVFRFDGKLLRAVATYNVGPENREFVNRNPIAPGRHSVSARAALERRTVQVPDVQADPEFAHAIRDVDPIRTVLAVPMLKGDELIGTITIYRLEVKPFTDKQVALVETFADQAVIAIENTRLLNELRESLQRQTATADVLKVISRSTFDLESVLNTLTASATRLCQADKGGIFQKHGDLYRLAAHFGFSPEEEQQAKQYAAEQPLRPGRGSLVGRVALHGRVVHINDVLNDPEYRANIYQRAFGYRTNFGVPLLREGTVIGVFTLMRTEVNSFSENEIDLVATFADQAVIAIENARLLSELRESLQQQTATADVLKVISRSTFDLQVVLDALVESAARLCEVDKAAITRPVGEHFEHVASYGYSSEDKNYFKSHPIPVGRGSVTGRTVLEGKVVHIPDLQVDPDYTLKIFNTHTVLGVPLMREGTAIGVIVLQRSTLRAFTDKQIELLTTFADQAVIAIENVRLFDSVEARTRELARSLEELRTTQDRLVQTQKLALLGQLTAGIAHEIKNPLNFVNNFSGISAELIDELQDALKGVSLDDKARTEINELTDTLKNNFDKVVHHGRRADAIVKNMLQHSREGSGEHRVIDINAVVEESLNLAWHGARAETQGFEIKLKQAFDPSVGEADVFPQDIRRALLNMISNGFYAASRRRAETNGGDYEPSLTASTKNLGDRVEIRIRDNGTGMSPDVKEKMFNPFFTTKP